MKRSLDDLRYENILIRYAQNKCMFYQDMDAWQINC